MVTTTTSTSELYKIDPSEYPNTDELYEQFKRRAEQIEMDTINDATNQVIIHFAKIIDNMLKNPIKFTNYENENENNRRCNEREYTRDLKKLFIDAIYVAVKTTYPANPSNFYVRVKLYPSFERLVRGSHLRTYNKILEGLNAIFKCLDPEYEHPLNDINKLYIHCPTHKMSLQFRNFSSSRDGDTEEDDVVVHSYYAATSLSDITTPPNHTQTDNPNGYIQLLQKKAKTRPDNDNDEIQTPIKPQRLFVSSSSNSS
jgi:hypothetical protein